jgi:catechol 2,3-dioxygenase-like lactoylglutathione lyase family enzyme
MNATRTAIVGAVCFAAGCMVTSQIAQSQAAPRLDGKFHHVAVVVRDANKAARTYADVFGVAVPPTRIVKNIPFPPSAGIKQTMATRTTMLQANGMNLEIIEPLEGPSPWRDFLNKYGEGVHHIAFSVPEWSPAVKLLESKGGKWVQGTEAVNFGYVDMMPQLGFTIEVMGPKLTLPPQD